MAKGKEHSAERLRQHRQAEGEPWNMRNECYFCRFMQRVPGNAHIKCTNPDPEMEGHEHGKKKGWFFYPTLFDPVWKTKCCDNFEPKED